METQLTVRLPADLDSKMRERAKRLRLKKADIVRMALVDFLEGPELTGRPYDRVKHLAGSINTGVPDLGERHREYLIQKIRKRASSSH